MRWAPSGSRFRCDQTVQIPIDEMPEDLARCLDPRVLEELRLLQPETGDLLIRRVIDAFLGSAQSQIRIIREAIDEDDPGGLSAGHPRAEVEHRECGCRSAVGTMRRTRTTQSIRND